MFQRVLLISFFNFLKVFGIFLIISSAIKPGPNFFAISPCIHTPAQLDKNGFSLFLPTKLDIIPLKTSTETITANSLDVCLFITTFPA